MIIKSMSRKTPSFAQLVDYIDKDSSEDSFTFNLYSQDPNEIKREFFENSQHIKKRKNGVYLYHEIVSLEKADDLSVDRQKEILKDIAEKYVHDRSSNALVFGKMHHDRENLHFHLMISANEVRNSKKIRMDKKRFLDLQKRMEQYKMSRYPELKGKALYNQKKDFSRVKQKEGELKRRTKQPSIREQVKQRLSDIINRASNKDELLRKLKENDFELYLRGNTLGVKDLEGNRNYRLKRLGLEDQIMKTMTDFERLDKRKEELERLKNAKKEKTVFERTVDGINTVADKTRDSISNTMEEAVEQASFTKNQKKDKTPDDLEIEKRKAELNKLKKLNKEKDLSMDRD